MSAPFPFYTGGSFTGAGLRETIAGILGNRYSHPSADALNRLAFSLNNYAGIFQYSRDVANKSRIQRHDVIEAIQTILCFLDDREKACHAEQQSIETIENERLLHKRFDAFLLSLQNQICNLDMDYAATCFPAVSHNWKSLAPVIAEAFKVSMLSADPPQIFGKSHTGPVPRFVYAVMPGITGETPTSLNAVGHHLISPYVSRKRS
ncbi:MAG TPA: hypothetical protein VFC54_05090 [Pseudolabrys sp.]|nr:hypothetical protein [Pseudolabrys sp.]